MTNCFPERLYHFTFWTAYVRSSFLWFVLLWLHRVACGILVPQAGNEHRPVAVKAPRLNNYTAREFPLFFILAFLTDVK